jgi:lipopolysaccharide/colanic/teichoic acid biosynthesis glycosyltransferase
MSMNRRPCTSCQNENGEFIGLQLQGDISKPHEALKIIAALSLTIIILITLTLLFIIVNIATQIKKCGLWIFNVFKTIYKKYIYKSDTNTMDKQQ